MLVTGSVGDALARTLVIGPCKRRRADNIPLTKRKSGIKVPPPPTPLGFGCNFSGVRYGVIRWYPLAGYHLVKVKRDVDNVLISATDNCPEIKINRIFSAFSIESLLQTPALSSHKSLEPCSYVYAIIGDNRLFSTVWRPLNVVLLSQQHLSDV